MSLVLWKCILKCLGEKASWSYAFNVHSTIQGKNMVCILCIDWIYINITVTQQVIVFILSSQLSNRQSQRQPHREQFCSLSTSSWGVLCDLLPPFGVPSLSVSSGGPGGGGGGGCLVISLLWDPLLLNTFCSFISRNQFMRTYLESLSRISKMILAGVPIVAQW